MPLQVTSITDFSVITEMANKGDLYVVNNTNHGNKRPRGNLHIDIVGEDQQPIAVRLPSTWLPQNLARFAIPALFLKSTTFRGLISDNTLIVIPVEEAKAIIKEDNGKSEQLRLDKEEEAFKIAYNKNMGGANVQSTKSGKVDIVTGKSGPVITASTAESESTSTNNIDDNQLQKIIVQFNDNIISDAEASETIRNLSCSREALLDASELITNTGSELYMTLGDLISGR